MISSYVNPGDIVPTAEACDGDNITYHDSGDFCDLPPLFMDLLQQSCLIPALCSYLRNDSGKIHFLIKRNVSSNFYFVNSA